MSGVEHSVSFQTIANRSNEVEKDMHLHPYDRSKIGCERTDLTLCIYPKSLPVSEITALLGLTPTSAVDAGDTVTHPRSGRSRIAQVSNWLLKSERHVDSLDIRDHLDWLLALLEPVGDAVRKLGQMPDTTITVRCIWWASPTGGGPTLWPKQMRQLADLDLECAFSLSDYNAPDPDIEPL